MKTAPGVIAIVLLASIAIAQKAAATDDFGTSLCSTAASVPGPVFIAFDQSYTLYTLNITTGPNGGNVVTRRDITSAEVASICAEGIDAQAFPDSTVQGSYFPTAVEFYNAALDHYFVTTDAREISDLETGVHPGWKRTGQQFQIYVQDPTSPSGQFPLAPVCRYYGLPAFGLDTHFFSAFKEECDAVVAKWPDRWFLETPDAFGVHLPNSSDGTCPQGTSPLYRLFNNRPDVNHRYTMMLSIRDQMIAQSWIPEGFGAVGVAMCVRPI